MDKDAHDVHFESNVAENKTKKQNKHYRQYFHVPVTELSFSLCRIELSWKQGSIIPVFRALGTFSTRYTQLCSVSCAVSFKGCFLRVSTVNT